MEKLTEVIINIITWGQNIYSTATTWIANTINAVTEWFAKLPGEIWRWLLNSINSIVQWGSDMVNKGRQAAVDLGNAIVDTIKGLPNKMLEIGKNIVEGIWNGITGTGKWISNKISSFCNGITDGFKDALGIHSPSRVLRDKVGQWIPKGIAVGIEANTNTIDKAVDKMNDEIINKMNRAVNVETGRISANAIVRSNANYNQAIYLNANFDGSVDIDGKKAGRILAPSVVKTIKTGGLA